MVAVERYAEPVDDLDAGVIESTRERQMGTRGQRHRVTDIETVILVLRIDRRVEQVVRRLAEESGPQP